jgi:release factor glutamine methyltransferase
LILKEVLDKTIVFFKDKKIPSARLDTELLLAKALNLNRIDLYLKFDQLLNETEVSNCREFVRRRAQGEPVAYILGEKDFYGHTFLVSKDVLIPRPETELLVEESINWLQKKFTEEESPNVLDLGTGSGCIAISILLEMKNAKAILVDVSQAAIEVAKKNAEKHGVLERCQFIVGDAAEISINKKLDIIISNPPYIANEDLNVEDNVKKYEPHLALFANDEGLEKLKKWSAKYAPMLTEKGWMGFEFGFDQKHKVEKYFSEKLNQLSYRIIKDLAQHDRHIVAHLKD